MKDEGNRRYERQYDEREIEDEDQGLAGRRDQGNEVEESDDMEGNCSEVLVCMHSQHTLNYADNMDEVLDEDN